MHTVKEVPVEKVVEKLVEVHVENVKEVPVEKVRLLVGERLEWGPVCVRREGRGARVLACGPGPSCWGRRP